MENIISLFKSRIVQLLIICLIIATIFALIQYFQNSKSDITGTFTLSDSRFDLKDGDECQGNGGYDDISTNAQVKVSDGSNNIIAVTSLDQGLMDGSQECVFKFSVKDVPKSNIYQFEVSNRGSISYSHNDLVENNYTVELSLGK